MGCVGSTAYAAPVDGLFDDATLRTHADVPGSGALQANTHASAPLAVRMRPRTLDELVGQPQLRAEGSPLRQLIEGRQSMSVLLWGPSISWRRRIEPSSRSPRSRPV